MTYIPKQNQIVFTNKAKCRDCYRCIRVCPVNAIGLRDGQAYVDESKCISCGTCIRECPQGAKTFRRDIDKVISFLGSEQKVAVSIAPSFASFFNEWEIKRIPSVLRKLGFSYVSETAVGAYYVAKETAKYALGKAAQAHIATACPAVVGYVERYKPELIKNLVPVASPMVAHGKMLKKKLGRKTPIVFIGPCIAKKAEAQDNPDDIDCVLTFTELFEWFETEKINLADFEESDFDEQPLGWARSFPLGGGSLRTASLDTDMLSANIISVSGIEETKDALDSITTNPEFMLIEPLFCEQGCINGPGVQKTDNIYKRRKDVLDYVIKNRNQKKEGKETIPSLTTSFVNRQIPSDEGITEEDIQEVYAKTGKENPENQLNCGACGYNSCRDQAIAVINKMAEPEMCIPHMRRLAERRTDKIIETSPNGIVILDKHLNIISMNRSFKTMFMCNEAVSGRKISYLMDPEPFDKLASGQKDFAEMIIDHKKYNLTSHQIVYALREENQYVGIFVNMTKNLMNKKKLDDLRAETLSQAQNLLKHQVDIARQIAQFLGQSTAESETLLENLMQMVQDDNQKIVNEQSND